MNIYDWKTLYDSISTGILVLNRIISHWIVRNRAQQTIFLCKVHVNHKESINILRSLTSMNSCYNRNNQLSSNRGNLSATKLMVRGM
jgi:hypothetical protein